MVAVKHYCLDTGQVEIVEVLADLDIAILHCRQFIAGDHGTDSVWYIADETTEEKFPEPGL